MPQVQFLLSNFCFHLLPHIIHGFLHTAICDVLQMMVITILAFRDVIKFHVIIISYYILLQIVVLGFLAWELNWFVAATFFSVW